MRSNKPNFFSRFRTSDRIILGVISVLALVTVVLNVMQRFGLALINQSVALYLPIAALVALSFAASYAMNALSWFDGISSGMMIIILTVAISLGAALLFPVKEEAGHDA